MDALVLVTAGLLIGAIVLGFLGALALSSDDLDLLGILLVLVAIMAGIFAVAVPVITKGGQAYGRNACASYARQTGRQTRFVVLNSLDSGTCMTPAADGRWVSTDQLRMVAK